jgi:hypothetical protein
MRGVAVVAAALGLGAGPAAAQTYFGCGLGAATGFRVCASSEVSFADGVLTMKVWNREAGDGAGGASYALSNYESEFGGWHTITGVGLRYMAGAGPAATFEGGYFWNGTSMMDLSWVQGVSSLQLRAPEVATSTSTGHYEGLVGCSDPLGNPEAGGGGGVTHYSTCGSYPSAPYAVFTFSGLDSFHAGDYEFVFRSQQIGRYNEDSAKGGSETVPEPATMLLLGSGLLGLAVVARRRVRVL